MARIKRLPRCAHPISACGGGGMDCMSALPNNSLHLDSPTALSTAVLASRWARLPRDLPSLGRSGSAACSRATTTALRRQPHLGQGPCAHYYTNTHPHPT
ncbi:unnamed protein product [Urochloa humidicola]